MQQLTYFILSLASLVNDVQMDNWKLNSILVFGSWVFIFFAAKAIGAREGREKSIKAFEWVGITSDNYFEVMELEAAFCEHLKQEKKYKKLQRMKMWERQLDGFDGRWKRLEEKIKKPT